MNDMLCRILLGRDLDTSRWLQLPIDSFSTHYHLIGATGAGKTTALRQILKTLMREPSRKFKSAVFVIDPMGGFSRDLLRWLVSSRRLQSLRDRLIYIEPSREEIVLPFNPLHFDTEATLYYQIARAVDLIQRAWTAQDLGDQPRLMQWAYKAMCAMGVLGYPIAMSRYLLHPGTQEHKALIYQLPDEIRYQWLEILKAKGSEATKILESTRNRFDPFHQSVILRRMFGQSQNRFDVERFIRDRRIVIVNLAKFGKLTPKLGSTIGSLIVNEIFEKAYNLATQCGRQIVDPTYVVLDEVQLFVGPDIDDALLTVRQIGLRLILAHQSFSQLQQGDIDLSNMIWQARSRLCFANTAFDADIMANEYATLSFDPMEIKDQRTSLKQLIGGYRREWVESHGTSSSQTNSSSQQEGFGYSHHQNMSQHIGDLDDWMTSNGTGSTHNNTRGSSYGNSTAENHGRSQTLVPIHQRIEEVSNITFKSFDEHRLEWMKAIRQLKQGHAFATLVNDERLYRVLVQHDPVHETSRIEAAVDALIEQNFAQDMFISAEEADRLAEQDRVRLLNTPTIHLTSSELSASPKQPSDSVDDSPVQVRRPRRNS